jgi:hypothetical protein
MIREWFERKMLADMGAIKDASLSPPAVSYVNLLIFQTIQRGGNAFTLRKSIQLPVVAEMAHPSPDVTIDKVINRLKVMCGFSPVVFLEPKKGTFEIWTQGREYVITCHFDDHEDEVCAIAIAAQ